MKNTPSALRRLSAPALAVSALGLLLCGCGTGQTVVGKWQTTATQPGASMHTEFDFTPGGKETMSFQQSGGARALAFIGTGTYTVSGSDLTQNITSLTTGGKPVRLTPGMLKPKTSTFIRDGDNLTLTDPATKQSLTFTRVKD